MRSSTQVSEPAQFDARGGFVKVQVDLQWSDGEPMLSVTENAHGLYVVADVRLSEPQVERACADLGDIGPAVAVAWRGRVGLT